jgi:hypothetical protein
VPKQRDKSASVPMMIRLPQALRERLERATAQNGSTLNKEIVARIETTFAIEASAGDAVFLAAAHQLLRINVTFEEAGRDAAARAGHPEWGRKEWQADPECYEAAALAVAAGFWLKGEHPAPAGRLGALRRWVSRLYGLTAATYRDTEEIGDLPPIEPSPTDLNKPSHDPDDDSWVAYPPYTASALR